MSQQQILRDALEAALGALACCYNVTDYPADGATEQDDAMRKIRAALATADAEGAGDAGPWRYATDLGKAGFVDRYFIESDDSTHDVRLYINGDFADDAQREQYGRALAETLNAAPTVLADEFTDDMYGAWDGIDNALQRAEMEKIYRAVRAAARPAPVGAVPAPERPTPAWDYMLAKQKRLGIAASAAPIGETVDQALDRVRREYQSERFPEHASAHAKPEPCTLCNGTGALDVLGGMGSICPHCNRSGKEPVEQAKQAEGASIDTPKFRELLDDYDHHGPRSFANLIAYIHAWAVQQAGAVDGERT